MIDERPAIGERVALWTDPPDDDRLAGSSADRTPTLRESMASAGLLRVTDGAEAGQSEGDTAMKEGTMEWKAEDRHRYAVLNVCDTLHEDTVGPWSCNGDDRARVISWLRWRITGGWTQPTSEYEHAVMRLALEALEEQMRRPVEVRIVTHRPWREHMATIDDPHPVVSWVPVDGLARDGHLWRGTCAMPDGQVIDVALDTMRPEGDGSTLSAWRPAVAS